MITLHHCYARTVDMYENVLITEVIEHRTFQLKTTVDIMKRDELGEKSCSIH